MPSSVRWLRRVVTTLWWRAARCQKQLRKRMLDSESDDFHLSRGERWDRLWVPGALILGVLVGIFMPAEPGLGNRISEVLGWTYFFAWSVSFYPQVVLNFRRKSVNGLSLDFQILNAFGFGCYFLFNALFFWNSGIRAAYREEHDNQDSGVRLNDVIFAGHAFCITLITLAQICIYWDYPRLNRQERLFRSLVVGSLCLVGAASVVLAIYLAGLPQCCSKWLSFLSVLAEVKVVISVVKYCPQVWLNYQRKSTVGWTIYNVLLDFTGGLLSVAQLLLDSWLTSDWSKVSGDPAKLMLGNVSVFFDVIFMIQHYCLYPQATSTSCCRETTDSSDAYHST